MKQQPEEEKKQWYVLHYFHNGGTAGLERHIADFNRSGERVELFAPIMSLSQIVDGRVVHRDKLLTFYYVFVKGRLTDIKELCALPNNGFSMMLDRSSNHRYGIVSEEAMRNFQILSRAYTNTIPFFNIEDIELEEGDFVEIVDGQYAGLTGRFMPKSRSTKGNLVIAATAAMGAVVWDIDAKYVRILDFAGNTRRQYDLIDSFIPRLYPIMRKFHAGERLTDREKTLLTVFNRRMGVVAPDNHKLEAKLLAILICVQTILGDTDALPETTRRFARRKNSLTNPWTLALTQLLLSISSNNLTPLPSTLRTLTPIARPLTRPQSLLLQELNHYINL